MPRLLVLLVLLIVYGSLYPWRFSKPRDGTLHTFRMLISQPGYFYAPDALLNVLFYVPVGACAYLAFRSWAPPWQSAAGAVLLGASLSGFVELAQVFEYSRNTNIFDVFANVAGSVVGVAAAIGISSVSRSLHRSVTLRQADAGALGLIVCWLAYLFFPFVPVLGAPVIRAKLAQAQTFDAYGFATAVVLWAVIGLAMKAAGIRRASLLCLFSVLLIPLQLFIRGGAPTLSDVIGALTGAVLFAVFQDQPATPWCIAVATLLVVFARGMAAPIYPERPQDFNWVPFAAMMEANRQRASRILISKVFVYGASIWTLHAAGLKLRLAVGLTAVVLALIEVIQMWLPRTPEITDPILALMIGVGLDAVRSRAARSVGDTETVNPA